MQPAYPHPVKEFTLDYTLCDGHWYLDAVLGRDLPGPSYVWLVLKDERLRLTVHRLTHLLEEVLVQASRCLTHQHPTHTLTYVLVGMKGTLGDVDEGTRTHLYGAAFY